MRVLRTVSFRVLAGTLLLLLLAFGLFATYAIRVTTRQLTDQAIASARRMSDFIVASTEYSMLLNRKQDVYHTARALGALPGVVLIRLYDERGRITFSTDSSEVGRTVERSAEACAGCHEGGRALTTLPPNRVRVIRERDGVRAVGVIQPVRNQPACAAGGCHVAPSERTVLGVFDVQRSLRTVDAAIRSAQRRTAASAVVGFLAVAAAAALFLRLTIRRPIRALTAGTEALARGELDHRIPVLSRDDFGALAASFNAMTTSLREAQAENERWARTLEERVRVKTEEVQRMDRQILQVEKMASLGTLAASVAHELNNPLSGILTYARLQAKRLRREPASDAATRSLLADLDMIAHEAERCGTIVRDLLLFSRRPEGAPGPVAVRAFTDRAVALLAHHLAMARVTCDVACTPADLVVVGDTGQLEQALVALMVNAVDAMPDGGTIDIRAVRDADGAVRLAVSDTGRGIPPADLPRVFEPFFTTKPQGQGVGLGLSVVYGIVRRHGATIEVASPPGRGTTFTIVFPPSGRAAERRAPAASSEPGESSLS